MGIDLRVPLERLATFFARRPTRQGWLARRHLGQALPGDELLRDQLIGAITGAIRPDGTVSGGTMPTLVALSELLDLEADGPVVERMIGWTLSRQGQPGAFSEGCTAARHPHRTCEHFLGGFFSPAPPAQRVAPVTFPLGKTYASESHARFAISCFALRQVVRAGQSHEPAVSRHLESFGHLVPEWSLWGDLLPPDLALSALVSLAVAPNKWSPTVTGLVMLIGGRQQGDGTWPRADFFNAVDALSLVRLPDAVPILERSIESLLQRQREDGSFGSVAQDERSLVALRAMLRVGGTPAAA